MAIFQRFILGKTKEKRFDKSNKVIKNGKTDIEKKKKKTKGHDHRLDTVSNND